MGEWMPTEGGNKGVVTYNCRDCKSAITYAETDRVWTHKDDGSLASGPYPRGRFCRRLPGWPVSWHGRQLVDPNDWS